MANISLVDNTYEIKQIILELNEICPIRNCNYSQDCAGKNNKREIAFTCNLKELILLYKNAPKKIIE